MKPDLAKLIVAGVLAGGFLTSTASAVQAAGDAGQETAVPLAQRMETHWRRLVQERDVERRRALIAEHRKLLDEARTAFGPAPNGAAGMGDMHGGQGGMMGGPGRSGDAMDAHHRQDAQSIVELHSMMLDMMQ